MGDVRDEKNVAFLGPFQTAYLSCAELNWWIRYGRRATYESIKYGRIWSGKSSTQVRQSLSHYVTLERHWFIRRSTHVPNLTQLWSKNKLIYFEFYWGFTGECAPTLPITLYLVRRLNHCRSCVTSNTIKFGTWRVRRPKRALSLLILSLMKLRCNT